MSALTTAAHSGLALFVRSAAAHITSNPTARLLSVLDKVDAEFRCLSI